MSGISSVLEFLDRHSGAISALSSLLAAIGLLLTIKYLAMYRAELRQKATEDERLAWERLFRSLHRISEAAARAHVASANHSPLVKQAGFLPPQVAEDYEPASRLLLNHWHQFRVELDLMPDSPLVDSLVDFVMKYDGSADGRASEQFAAELQPLVRKVAGRAQLTFRPKELPLSPTPANTVT